MSEVMNVGVMNVGQSYKLVQQIGSSLFLHETEGPSAKHCRISIWLVRKHRKQVITK